MFKFSTVIFFVLICIGSLKAQEIASSPATIEYIGPGSVDLQLTDSKPRLIRYCKAGTEDWTTISNNHEQKIEINNLRPRTTYYYQISEDAGNSWSAQLSVHTPGRPNILMILIDDGRYDNWGPNGQAPSWFVTPNVDRIANEGAVFKYCYPAFSLCSPSRASIVSGLYPHHTGVVDNSRIDKYTFPIAADAFHDSGYYCGYIGKLGFIKDPGPSYDYYIQSADDNYWDATYFLSSLHGNSEVIKGHKTNILTDSALYFLSHRDRSKPFLLYLAHKAPHVPLDPRAEDSNLYKGDVMPVPPNFYSYETNFPNYYYECHNFNGSEDSVRAQYLKYYELLAGVEWSVGQVLDTLEAQGILDSTLIIFTSDNGLLKGEHLLEGKQIALEESLRLPLFIRYPAWYTAGSHFDDNMFMNIDFTATMFDAAGFNTPFHTDGVSIHDITSGKIQRKEFLYEFYNTGPPDCSPNIHGVRDFSYEYLHNTCNDSADEFYDLTKDSLMNTNLINDTYYAPLIAQYKLKLDSLREVYTDTKPDTTVKCQLENIVVTGMEMPEDLPDNPIVSPNPGDGVFRIELTDAYAGPMEVEVISATGAVYYKQQMNLAKYGYLPVNIHSAPPGIYAIRISSSGISQGLTYVKVE